MEMWILYTVSFNHLSLLICYSLSTCYHSQPFGGKTQTKDSFNSKYVSMYFIKTRAFSYEITDKLLMSGN